jgi:hypothetical protein
MASKIEVISWLSSNFETLEEIELGYYTVHLATKGGRSQKVWIKVLDSAVVLESPFGDDSQASAEIVLGLVADQCNLGLSKTGRFYVLRHVVPIEDVDPSELQFGVNLVANEADTLEIAFGKDNF